MAGAFLLVTGEGDVYSADEIRDWLQATGWRMIEHTPLVGPASLIVAEKVAWEHPRRRTPRLHLTAFRLRSCLVLSKPSFHSDAIIARFLGTCEQLTGSRRPPGEEHWRDREAEPGRS